MFVFVLVVVFVDDEWQSTCGGLSWHHFFRQVSVLSLPLPNTEPTACRTNQILKYFYSSFD